MSLSSDVSDQDLLKRRIAEEEDRRERERMQEIARFQQTFKGLPENVRKAILVAQYKKKHSDFYYKLSEVNDKI